jgi:hypothetical protein
MEREGGNVSLDSGEELLTRRSLVGRGAGIGLGLSATLAAGSVLGSSPALAARAAGTRSRAVRGAGARRPVPLPTPAQVRDEFTTMVEFGPRLTASGPHSDYVDWLEQEFIDAGLKMLPRDNFKTDRWLAQQVGLDILSGPSAGPVKVATYFPRSQETPAGGVTGPLVYGGTAPTPSISLTGVADLEASLARYPSELESWAGGLQSLLGGGPQGSILLIDLPLPVPATTGALMPDSTFLYWPGHSLADWMMSDFKRISLLPGLQMPLAQFQQTGARGVVFILDCSYEALKGGYLPFDEGFQPLPALYVDRDTGRALRAQAAGRPNTRLTLTATREQSPTQAITAVLPGASSEVIIFNTHTDGQGFVEENGGVAFVQLARYFASRPRRERLRRTLVFAAWPGHMVADLTSTGWMQAHPDILARAAAALTVEHLGCTEWIDTVGGGYQATGQPETFFIWTTQGKMFDLTRDAVLKHRPARTALMRPPAQFGVGSPYQTAGIPQIGAIAGPEYMLTISPNGDLDKVDEHLAAKQIACIAGLATNIDPVSASLLRQGDPTLGLSAPPPPSA